MAQRRPATEKAKATRARSWNKNQAAKAERLSVQLAQEAHNRKVGTTGKQRDNELRKALGTKYREGKRAQQGV